MTQNETASAGTEAAHWTAARAASQSLPYCTASRTARQVPAWIVSKAAADRSWPGVRSLLLALGFSDPTPSCRALDWQGVDIVAGSYRFAWRNRAASYFGFQDVTVRLARPSGQPTEADKLQAGAVDFCLWTWIDAAGAVCQWLLLDAVRIVPLLAQAWRTTDMGDATFCAVPWAALAAGGAIVRCSDGVRAAL